MKSLVLGGAGFIGLNMVKALSAQGHQVDGYDIHEFDSLDEEAKSVLTRDGIHYYQADMTAPNALTGISDNYDFIFHFAALLGVENVSRNPYNVLKFNAEMTFAAIEAGKRQKNLKKIFFTSTSEVYGGTLHYHGLAFPTPESTPLTVMPLENPRTSYMLSKIYGEALLMNADLPYVIVRPHNVYGPRMGLRHVVPQLLEKAYKSAQNGVLAVYSPAHKRTFCYIDDAISYLMHMLNTPDVNIVCNLGNGAEEVSMRELATQIVSLVNSSLTIEDKEETSGSPERRIPQTTIISSLTGYTPQTSLATGLQKTYEWYQQNVFAVSSHT